MGTPTPEKFGDFITADHAVMAPEEVSRQGHRFSLIILDRYSSWLQGYAALTKDAHETKINLQRFMGPKSVPDRVYTDGATANEPAYTYTDGSGEFKSALKELGWCHDTSTPYRSQTNGVAERSVRKVKEGTSCTLAQSGFEVQWWPEAMTCYCFLRGVTDVMKDGFTPYKSKFLKDFKGDKIPFGAELEYRPSAPNDRLRLHKYGNKTLQGIFIGYDQRAGGDWSGDYLVVDWQELEQADNARDVHVKRVKEINKLTLKGKFRFPLAEGALTQPAPGETHLRKRTQRLSWAQDRAPIDDDQVSDADEHFSENHDEPTGSPPRDRGHFLPDKWRITKDLLIIHHNQPRTKLFQPTEENCPIPLKYIDVMRTTETNLEDKSLSKIEDFWGSADTASSPKRGGKPCNAELSEPWTGKTTFELLRPLPPSGYSYIEGRLTKTQETTRPGNIWPEIWRSMSQKMKREAILAWEIEGTKRDKAREQRGIKFVPEEEIDEYTKILAEAYQKLALPEVPSMPILLFPTEKEHPINPASRTGSYSQSAGGNPIGDQPIQRAAPIAKHQENVADKGFVSESWMAMVHTPVKDWQKREDARKAVDKEWDKLADKKAWILESVREYEDVSKEATSKGKTVHFGDLMRLCHVKHSELAEKYHSFKGRVVFRGDNVRDESGHLAVFSEQGTSASHLAAAKFLDAIARMPENDGQDSDATGAYTQAEHAGAETWVHLPRDKWPKSWHNKYKRPVVRLRLNLYGHPLAGLFWEQHCSKAILKCGFEAVTGWECLYKHNKEQLFLSVYVDDFKMAGNKKNLSNMWKRLGALLDIDTPTAFRENVYLGCGQQDIKPPTAMLADKQALYKTLHADVVTNTGEGKPVAEELSEPAHGHTERGVKTGKQHKSSGGTPRSAKCGSSKLASHEIKAYQYDMRGHAEQCILRYLELAKVERKTLKHVTTPCMDDHQFAPEDFVTTGKLATIASKSVLKVLYLARVGRPDLLWTVNDLARNVTKWNVACDRRLHRLISYLEHTREWVQTCFVGDPPEECKIVMYVDAGFAGDLTDSKSTSGATLFLVGPNTFVPITWLCKKQGAVSHSSTEAEVIALDAAMRMEGIPMLMLWDQVIEVFSKEKPNNQGTAKPNPENLSELIDFVPPALPKPGKAKLLIMEDNEAVIKITIKGRSPNLRYVGRTHRVDLDFVSECFRKDTGIAIRYVGTKNQMADLLTKGSFTGPQWTTLVELLQLGSPAPPIACMWDFTPSNLLKSGETQDAGNRSIARR